MSTHEDNIIINPDETQVLLSLTDADCHLKDWLTNPARAFRLRFLVSYLGGAVQDSIDSGKEIACMLPRKLSETVAPYLAKLMISDAEHELGEHGTPDNF